MLFMNFLMLMCKLLCPAIFFFTVFLHFIIFYYCKWGLNANKTNTVLEIKGIDYTHLHMTEPQYVQ